MKRSKPFFCALTALAFCSAATAQSGAATGPRTYATLGYTVGGDVLVTGTYSNTGEAFTLRAGQGFLAMVGVQYPLSDKWSGQAAVGYHYDRTHGDGWNFEFTRFPAELMVHYALNDDWRVGLGGRYSLDPKFKSLGTFASQGSRRLSASPGAVLELQYMLYPLRTSTAGRGAAGGISLKWAQENYTLKGVSSLARDGQHIAISLFGYF
ncbi:MAG: transporter [Betaproteobacteria bacterium]